AGLVGKDAGQADFGNAGEAVGANAIVDRGVALQLNARIDLALRQRADLVRQVQLEQRRSAERGAVARAELNPVVDPPVGTHAVGPVAVVAVAHAVDAADRLHVGDASRRRQREVLDERRAVDHRDFQFAERLLRLALAEGPAAASAGPYVAGERR